MTWVIDLEASGLHPESYPIEVAFKNVETGQHYSSLIKPFSSWVYWDANAENNIHHISRELLFSEGVDPVTVCDEILNMVGNDPVFYSDASDYDGFWLNRLFEDSGFSAVRVDSVYFLIEDDRRSKFYEALMLTRRPHRALADVEIICSIIKKFK